MSVRVSHKTFWELRDALAEVHEFQCGCDEPGRLDLCVAQPTSAFAVLRGEKDEARLSAAEVPRCR